MFALSSNWAHYLLVALLVNHAYTQNPNTEEITLIHAPDKNIRCSLVAIQALKQNIYLQESSQSTYPQSNRIDDGFDKDTDFCLYESILNGIGGPIVSLVELNSTISGILVFGREAQYDIPEQNLSDSVQIVMHAFTDGTQISQDFMAKNEPGLFNQPKLLELYAISDKAMVEDDGHLLLPRMMVTLATANQMTRAVGLTIRLVRWKIWSDENEFPITGDISTTLADLSTYRFSLNPELTKRHDSMHLFTGERQDSRGKAYINGMCRVYLAVSITSTSDRDNMVSRAAAFTHEIGHLLGSVHDRPSWRENAEDYTDICFCPDYDCIMSPALSDPGPVRFSNCTMATLLKNIHGYEGDFDCLLDNSPETLISENAICGNSQVEPGEQCDIGTDHDDGEKTTELCDPKTCKFVHGNLEEEKHTPLLCPWVYEDPLPDDCCEMIHNGNGTEARFAQKQDESPCDDHQGFCRGGFCQSLDYQCKRGFGMNFHSAPVSLYAVNGGKSWSTGYCSYVSEHVGFERYDFSTKQCTPKNKQCGSILCTDGSIDVNVDLDRYDSVIRHHLLVYGQEQTYVSAIRDETLSGAPETLMVADGLHCENTGICENHQCVM